MLAVPYFERALYEADEETLTPAGLLALADEVEERLQGGLSPRPLLSVPHILADESSCYYHGYVLAEMAVHQVCFVHVNGEGVERARNRLQAAGGGGDCQQYGTASPAYVQTACSSQTLDGCVNLTKEMGRQEV